MKKAKGNNAAKILALVLAGAITAATASVLTNKPKNAENTAAPSTHIAVVHVVGKRLPK